MLLMGCFLNLEVPLGIPLPVLFCDERTGCSTGKPEQEKPLLPPFPMAMGSDLARILGP